MAPGLPRSTPTTCDTPPFLVGIAGASSSGKTVLSLILAEIFQAAANQGQHNNTSVSTSGAASTITIISQDEYFIAKSECPLTTFRPRPGDEMVVAGHVSPDGKVEAADTDCLEAVDWVRLLDDLDAFLAGQKQQQRHGGASVAIANVNSAHQSELAHYRRMMGSFIKPELRDRMTAQVRACIDQQVMCNSSAKFEGRLFKKGPGGATLLNCRLGFVEGFLLYAREAPLPLYQIPQKRQDNGHDDANGSTQQQQQQQQPPEPRMQQAVRISQEAVRDRFHDRLYIHVTTETACQRRFSRSPYIDQPQGQRMPGQMWKTKGYFFDVARANFYKYDLINSTLVTHLWQGQNIIENAIRSVLDKMKDYEDEARKAANLCAKEEETMARMMGEMSLF